MASKTFSGQLDQAMNEAAAEGNKILFIPQQTVGEVLPGAASELVVESDGTYSIKLAYNTYSIYHYSDVTKRKTLLATDIVVSTDTAVTTIPDLLGSVVPVTEDSVLTIQGYLDEANEAKTDAETAQAATEALFDDFDSSVADSMALVHTDTPSLSIPFNESGRLDYGIGTEYVSGLPVYGVDFTRSTASTVINKSGVLETLSADEMGIGADGVWLHGAYTMRLASSIDSTLNDESTTDDDLTLTSDLSPDGSSYWVTFGTSGNGRIDTYSSADYSDGDYVTESLFLKKGTGQVTLSGFYNISVGDNTGSFVTFYADGSDPVPNSLAAPISYGQRDYGDYYRVWVTWQYLDDNSSQNSSLIRMQRLSGDDSTVWGVNITNTSTVVPYVESTGGATSITGTACTLPVIGNFPANGDPFTIVFDAEFIDYDGSNYTVFTINSDVSGGSILFRKNNGSLQWFHDESDGTDGVLFTGNESYTVGRHRYSLTFSDGEFAMYCDGTLITSRTNTSYCWFDADGKIYLASTYNNQLKNFKVLPYAASADEVKSWGAPK